MQPVKHLLRFAIALLLLPGLAGATSFVRVADGDLVDQASVIAEVVVSGSDYSLTPTMPVTDYRVEATRVLRGDLPGSTVIVRVHGGQTADGLGLKIYGAPAFRVGERALLFLRPATDGTYRILHVVQGAFRVVESAGRAYAVHDFGEAEEVELEGRSLAAEGPRDLDQFSRWIESRLAGESRPADYFVRDLPLLSAITARYTLLTTSNGFNMRWDAFDASQNVTFVAHSAGQPGRTGGGFDDLQTAINAWNDDGVTNIRYRYGGTTTVTAGFNNFDGINAVVWDNLDNAGGFDEVFSCSTGGTLAIGGPWFSTSTRHTKFGRQFVTIQGADVVTNKGLECWINNFRRLEEVLTHELGHTLGLGHSCGDDSSGSCDTNTKNEAVMRAQAHGDNRGASLRSDDLAAINALYGTGSGETAPAAPSNLRATAQTGSGILVEWNDNSTNESSFLLERRTTGSFQEIRDASAGTTSYLDTSASSGITYTYRVRAVNGTGSSEYSNEASALLAGEKAPTNLVANSTGATTVALTWTDNATSETGFDIEAKLAGAAYEVVATTAANTQALTVTGLFAESTYTFRVRAKGGLGASNYSNEATASTALAPIGTCTASATRSCLAGNRFQVEVKWKDFGGIKGNGQVVPFGSADSGLYYFFSAGNWELLVKVLNGCGLNSRFWVYAAATTNVEYTLYVTDTHTGRTQYYYNPLGTAAAAITDSSAFDTCSTPLAGEGEALTQLPELSLLSAETLAAWAASAAPAAPASAAAELGEVLTRATCTDTATALCLQNERFKVEVTWTNFQNVSGPGMVVPAGTADSGLFYFFSATNWEMLVKVLNGCGINNRIWVLAAATTNVGYTLKVTDMNNPGSPKTYTNPVGTSAPALIDIEAFASCQ